MSCSDRLAGITTCPTFSAVNVDSVLLNQVLKVAPWSFGTSRGDQVLTDIATLEAKEAQLVEEAARIEEFITKVGRNLDSLARMYINATEALAQVRSELAALREVQILTADDYILDEEFLSQAHTHLYSNTPESRLIRAELHLKLARLIEHIWVWGYDVAVIEWKDADWRSVLPLQHKSLPSRADPRAKYHRPVAPREVPHGGPFYGLLVGGEFGFEPPPPQHRNRVVRSTSSRQEDNQFADEVQPLGTFLH
jgi:hypothetical protein